MHAAINTSALNVIFSIYIIVVKEEDMKFVQVTNVDNKVQTEKEVRKHGNMLPISIRGVCGSSNCCKTNVISLLESPHGLRFENVYVYSKSTTKISIFGEFIDTD